MRVFRAASRTLALTAGLSACGTTGGGETAADASAGPGGAGGGPAPGGDVGVGGNPIGGSGGAPVAGAGGSGGTPVGGEGGTPVGGTGGTPVGGEGGTGGVPVGGEQPDAARPDLGTPDATQPDAALPDLGTPDAALPDAARPDLGTPDAALPDLGTPDAALPDAALPDAAAPDMALEPDAAPPPAYVCGNLPVLDLMESLTPVDADHFFLTGDLPDGQGEIAGTCGGGGHERVYGFTAPADGVWRFDLFHTETNFDTVLYLLSECPSQADGLNLRCNDDLDTLASGIVKELRAGDVVYLVVDAFGDQGGHYRLDVGRLPPVQEREVCDAFSEQNACADELYCFALNQPGQPPAEEGLCVNGLGAPVIHSVQALRNGDVLNLAIDASDFEADVQRTFILELLAGQQAQVVDPQTGATEALLDFRENALGNENFTGTVRLNIFGMGAWPNTTAVRVRVRDIVGNLSDSTTAQVAPQPIRNAGAVCDVRRVLDACAEGSGCLDPDGDGRATCGNPTAPTLDVATVTRNEATQAYALTFQGRDRDHDIAGFVIAYFDAGGNLIEPPGQEQFEFERVDWNGDAYTAHARLRLSGVGPLTQTLGLLVFDRTEQASDALFVDAFGEPAVVGRGQACDLFFGGRDACAAGNLCYSPNYGALEGTCQAPIPACPPDFEASDLTLHPVGAEWRVDSSLASDAAVTRASCGNMVAQEVFTFTAPRAGTYRFRTESDEADADTVIFVRSFCRYEDYGAELACHDDVSPQNFLSDVAIDLQGGETVYVFVGGSVNGALPKGGFRGRYRLVAARR